MEIRKASVAGKFYPNKKDEIVRMLNHAVQREKTKFIPEYYNKSIIGGIVPHAGYIYSSYQAVHFYDVLHHNHNSPETVVIINPNHTGYGFGNYNTCGYDAWETPMGMVPIDTEFRDHLTIEPSHEAHRYEHSGEVQLPMLQYFLREPFRVVMITMNLQSEENAFSLASEIAAAQNHTGRNIVIIASSDFSHFESPETGFMKDQFVIDEILKMNEHGVVSMVKLHQVTTCGYGPVMALISYAKRVSSGSKIEILCRGHSGEVYHSNEVVDYVSMVCYY